jgi:hypothetical protein
MEEIKEGDYIRTEDGEIRKIVNIDKTEQTENNPVEILWCNLDKPIKILKECSKDTIYAIEMSDAQKLKHSNNILDLIEVGDFVNEYRVLAIEASIYANSKRILIYKNEREKYERWIYIQEYNGRIKTQDDIVVILTKEQYDANCYKVGGENE